ncbi:LPS-assembly protein [Altererythrobacter atlanticus]|uniref:LPS-assembly protein LptD n=1 Tax=Croceibacterium atlanticum TaxID=1267766 RepID=A0A0F7KTP4_9SPHN|nr:LPS assembly protein LptD [Croceibacterium atlanticum]AKH42170.1 LPS-assembly protein LptD precursor [Croceibacterium atlanticum]MBB5734017.1 LPS-assembly protein [Croceibacterium atlanticum]
MRPRSLSWLQARDSRLQPLCSGSAAAVALLCVAPVPAFAQAAGQTPETTETVENGETDSPIAGRDIDFEADEIRYDSENETVAVAGNVILRSGDQSVRADNVTWDRTTGQIVASGNIRFVDQDGNQILTERLELTDELKAGAMENMLLAFRAGGRMAAAEARRTEDGNIQLDRAVYSTCSVEDSKGCPKRPSWRVTARRVHYDEDTQQVRFEGAYLEMFGRRVLPLPGLVVRADGDANSGFLVPDIGLSASNGLELVGSHYWRLADNRDLLASAYIYTEAAPMASVEYRHLTANGAYQATGYFTYSTRIPLNSDTPTSEEDIRGYLFTNGRFQLDPYWSVSGSVRYATDRTFLRRYDISRDDRLRSTVQAERIDDDSYFSVAGWATQALFVQQEQGLVPIALPILDYRHRIDDPLFGGKFELQANTLAITRTSGQDTQRAFAKAEWNMRRLTAWGQEVTFTALARGDVYHSDENLLSETESYRGNSGWEGRGVATGAIDVKWPLVGTFLGGTQVLTPRVQLVASPSIKNLAIPNEDARAIDLEDSNLFALNRFPGYDRIEDGTRITYGADWQLEFPGWRIKANIGQSYRLSDKPTLFPEGTGLTEQWSDFVGRTEVRYRDFLKFTHRYRVDKDNFAVRRNEVDATIGNDRTYVELGYLRLNRDIDLDFEDLQDREELRAAGRISFARYWSVFGSAVVNLTDKEEDPGLEADGFKPLRTRVGIAYSDDCLEFGLTWRRDYIELADARSGNSFRLHFALKNIGGR